MAHICMFQRAKDPLLFSEARAERRGRKMLVWSGHCLKTEHDSPCGRATFSHVWRMARKLTPFTLFVTTFSPTATGGNLSDCLSLPLTHYLFTSFIWHKILTSCCLFYPNKICWNLKKKKKKKEGGLSPLANIFSLCLVSVCVCVCVCVGQSSVLRPRTHWFSGTWPLKEATWNRRATH